MEPIVPDLRDLFDGKVGDSVTDALCDQPDTSGVSSAEAETVNTTSRRSRLPVPIVSVTHKNCEETVQSQMGVQLKAHHDMFGSTGRCEPPSSEAHRDVQSNRRLRPGRHIRRPARYRD